MYRKKVLKKIKPSFKEEDCVDRFLNKLIRTAETITQLDCVFVGSIGRKTWLSGAHDIDLFIKFPLSTTRKELEKKGLEYGKKITSRLKGKFRIKYAEHPYVNANIMGFNVDIVPCYDIKKGQKIMSSVDRSPLHLDYIVEKLDFSISDEVRLLKQFCRGIGIYGSDTKTMGFSGYICELLVIKHKSFENVLKNAAKWSAPYFMGMNKNYSKDKFREQPLIIIDPVDSSRNAAANVSPENFIKFIENSEKFMKKPGIEYFFPKRKKLSSSDIKKIMNRGTNFIIIKMKKPDLIDDILYPQIRRLLKRIVSILEYNEFIVLRSIEFVNKDIFLLIEAETWELPDIKKMKGPPIFSKDHSKSFLNKYRKLGRVYVEGNRWVAEKQRDYKNVVALIANLKKRNKKELKEEGVPNNLIPLFKKAKVTEKNSSLRIIKKDLTELIKEKYF